jgi:hypothetical protein
MLVVFSPKVQNRLAEIEAIEGVPAVELVHQAVEVFSHLDGDERRALGFFAMQIVVRRAGKGDVK